MTTSRIPLSRWRRHRSGAALITAALLGTAACGGADRQGTSAAGGDCSEIAFSVLAFIKPTFEEVVAAYEEQSDTDVTIRDTPPVLSDYVQQLATQRLGGDAPDLFMTADVIAEQLADSGFAEDLNTWFEKGDGLTREDFAGQFLNSYIPLKSPDQVTGLPVAADATVVFYNKQIFDDAGVDYPTDEWTYDEFTAIAQEISEAGDGEYYGLAPVPPGTTPVSPWQAQYQPLIVANGGYVYDKETNRSGIGEPEAIAGWEQLFEAWQNGGVPAYEDVSGASPPEFAGGSYGMIVGVRAHIPGFKEGLGDGWDVARMPLVGDKRPVGGGSYGMGMASSSECKDAAWDFLNWFYSNDGGISLMQENYSVVPPTVEGIESGAWRDLPAPPENNEAFAHAISDATIAPQLPGGAQATLDEAVLEATQQVLLNGASIEEAFRTAQDTVNAALEEQE